MKLKKGLLKSSRLYIIVDKHIDACSYADIVQLRDKYSPRDITLKKALNLRKLFLKTKTIFIVNDYLDIAKTADADGLHLGQEDLAIEIARRILGRDKIIGISCHNLTQALDAQDRGADYIGIGPIFKSPTKPEISRPLGLDIIKEIKNKIRIPFFAIGGINEKNIKQVLAAGAERVAVCSAAGKIINI